MKKASSPVALITGGSSTLGRAVALRLATEGFRLVLHYGRSRKEAERFRDGLRAQGLAASLVKADLGTPQPASRAIEEALEPFGRLDLLVHNASLFEPTPTGLLDERAWERIFRVNLASPYFISCRLRPWLEKSRGVIVNITDIYGEHPLLKDHSAYCLSKGGLITLTKFLAAEWGPLVRVNAVSPGVISFPKHYSPGKKRELAKRSLMRRGGTPDEIAEAVLYLLKNRFVTGQVLRVDGGRFL